MQQRGLPLPPAEQETILRLLAADALLRALPLESQYHQRFLKQLLAVAESQAHDLSEQLVVEYSAALMPQVQRGEANCMVI